MFNSTSSRRLPIVPAFQRWSGVIARGWSWIWRGGSVGFRHTLDLLVPPTCPLCGVEGAEWDEESGGLCEACLSEFSQPMGEQCPRCAAPRPPVPSAPCLYCRERKYRFDATLALGYYWGAVREAVLRMKYGYHEPLTLAVATVLAARLEGAGWRSEIDLVAPVPLHAWKRLRRGASAPELLAGEVARSWNVPVVPRLLVCARRTQKQGTLLPRERLENVRGAFEVESCYDITNARVLLVDDVMTTGATADEAARALRTAGAAAVRVATVARGTGETPPAAMSGRRNAGTERE